MDEFRETKEDQSAPSALPSKDSIEEKPVFDKVKSDLIHIRRNRRTFIKPR